jgi:hypothetical protein
MLKCDWCHGEEQCYLGTLGSNAYFRCRHCGAELMVPHAHVASLVEQEEVDEWLHTYEVYTR